MRVNRVERREHERRSGQDRRKMPDRKNSKREITDRRKEEKRKEIRREEDAEKRFDDQIEGRNSVLELLESGKDVNKIFVARGEKHGSINKILGIAKERKIIVVEKDKKQMDEMAQEENYQGVIAIVPPFEYVEISDILEVAKERNEDPFVIVLDGIEDPHNLGSIIRTAETAGVHGVIIPKRRAVSVNSTVNKASAGAVEHMKIARVTNISDAIEELKKAGLWVCGTAVDTNKYYYNQDLTGALAIVIGNEGKGIGEKVKKNCDFLVKIPMKGKIQSLNASVSTGIVVYEAVKQRIRKEN
jgi:23S rRNA (guanosine2251-2'-O)-methyltransferase